MSDRGMFFDLDGQPIDVDQWTQLRTAAPVVVGEDSVNDTWVATIWVGVDYSFGDAPQPMIYETAIVGGPLDGDVTYWPNATEARAGHTVTVERVAQAYDALQEANRTVLDRALRQAADAALAEAGEIIATSRRKRRHARG